MAVAIFDSFSSKRSKLAIAACVILLIAAIGTYISGQYRIGRLDVLMDRYDQPVTDYAEAYSKTKLDSLEGELLSDCKQSQIGSWLQTTDALQFEDPISGNRVLVRLEPGKDFIDLNGKEISSCVQDEVENRQFDIGSMTNTWAFCLVVLSFAFGGLAWFWGPYRRKTPRYFGPESL